MMTGLKFNDLEALNIEIMKTYGSLNSRKNVQQLQPLGRFLEVERQAAYITTTRFISKSRKTTTVMRNSYVSNLTITITVYLKSIFKKL